MKRAEIRPPVRVGAEPLPDGRLLGWAEWGPPDGTPVLLSPGAATGRSLGFGAGVVDGLGVRLISLDRPGLGVSTPSPGRTFAGFADDVRAFAARRGLDRPVMVGNSQGAPFALACAARSVTRACDLAVYREPTFAAAYRRALDEAFAPGPEGYARDTALAMGRWDVDLASITVPVDLWYGQEDTGHSPDQGASLTARVPGAVRHLVPGIGGAVLWTHAKDVLRALLKHSS
ncbi:alpha/beta fold hydrolase [Nonomuraea sp. NPDC005650]|uniref:alpha/beta fold hydrolase n=1 Tax=Nonomuraea sp. NPDC005650 TaxID=3157045 RepID=UPI0033A359D0